MELITNNAGTIIKILGGITFVLFGWEHYARTSKKEMKPSVAFNWLAIKSKAGFNWIGTWLAKLSSFYTYINLTEFLLTAVDFFKPLFSLFWSPWQVIKGYITTATSYANSTVLIWLGSMTLLCVLSYVWFYYDYLCQNYHFWPLTLLPLHNNVNQLLQ